MSSFGLIYSEKVGVQLRLDPASTVSRALHPLFLERYMQLKIPPEDGETKLQAHVAVGSISMAKIMMKAGAVH